MMRKKQINTRMTCYSYWLWLLILCIISVFFFSCSKRITIKQEYSELSDQLVLITTTDFHASLDKAEGLGHVVRELRKKYGDDNVLHLDAGDLFQGSIEASLSKGKAVVDFYNLIKVDAAAIGNHELDYGVVTAGRVIPRSTKEDPLGNIKKRVTQAKFQWLSANILYRTDSPTNGRDAPRRGFKPHAVFIRANKKICVVGLTTPSTPFITQPIFVRDIEFADLKSTAESEVQDLKKSEKCDATILTAHAGLVCNKQKTSCQESTDKAEILHLIKALPARTFDAVVAGHTHIQAQEVINGTPVIESGAHAQVVGVLRLWPKNLENEKQNKHIVSRISTTHSYVPYWQHQFEPFITIPQSAHEPDVTTLLAPYRKKADAIKNQVLGNAATQLPRDYENETALGNFIADALRSYASTHDQANFTLLNAGGIRSDLPAGPITYGNLFKILPFDNSLAIVHLKGRDLKSLLEIAFSGAHGVSVVSGLKIQLTTTNAVHRDLNGDDKKEDWERNQIIAVLDEKKNPIEDEKIYTLATVDFLTNGGDHQKWIYDKLKSGVGKIRVIEGLWIRDIVKDYLKRNPLIDAKKIFSHDGLRITWIEDGLIPK